MSTITLPNIRVSSDLTVKVRLKDSGVAIDWSTLTKIKASIYSDAQRALAGRCDVSIDAEDSTLLVCNYAANKPQYVGVNRIVVSAKYMGETKTYDKPAFTFVRWTADQEGEQITIDDPDVDVEISVEDISSSILQEAVDAAFEAADRANDAAAAAEHMVDIHTGPEGKSAYEVAVEEGYVGTEEEWLASLVGPQGQQGIQGETGEAAGFGTVSAALQEDGGEPSVAVAASGTDTSKNFAFTFKNLKGDKGDKGDQGNSGYTGAAGELEVVNNLTDGGAAKALSAEMGKTLEGEVSQLEAKVDENIDGETTIEKDYVWADGGVNNLATVASSTTSKFCQPILFKKGEVLTYRSGGARDYAVVKVADNTPIAIGDTGFVITNLICGNTANVTLKHTFDEDTWVVITVEKDDYSLSVKKTALSVVKYSGYAGLPIGTNILTPSLINSASFYLRRQDGVTPQSGGFGVTDFIEIPPDGLVATGMLTPSGSYAAGALLYDADKIRVGYIGNVANVVIPSATYKYVRFNLGNPANLAAGTNYAVFTGTYTQPYSAPVERYGIIEGEQFKDGSIELSKLADVKSKNLIKKVYAGKYYVPETGEYLSNASYTSTDRIFITPGVDYVVNHSIRAIYLFNTSGILTRTVFSTTFTAASNETMVIVDFNTNSSGQYMLEEGTVSSEYTPYKLQFKEDVIPYKELPDGSVTQSKIAPGVSLPGKANPFNSFAASGTIASGETLNTQTVLISNRQVLSAEIIGTIEDVLVGVGNGNLYGCWLQITPTQVKVVYGSSSTVAATYSHGLTLGTRTKVMIERGSELSFHIVNDAGGKYSNTIRQFVGKPFVKNNGTTSLSVSIRYGSRIADARIWCAGDSYWSFGDQARIPYNLTQLGASEMLVVARGGESAGGILPSLQALVGAGGRPSYIVWALGMNGGTDEGGNVNTNWMNAVNTFLDMCEDTGSTPVFCTVPTVPTASHDAMNAWIRNSGYRYIDVAEEVEQSGTNTWRGWGTDDALLSSDQVHPSQAGALQIASRIIVDFPEITQLNP